MIQWTNPISFRLLNTKNYLSNWYLAHQKYPILIKEDFLIRQFVILIFRYYIIISKIVIMRLLYTMYIIHKIKIKLYFSISNSYSWFKKCKKVQRKNFLKRKKIFRKFFLIIQHFYYFDVDLLKKTFWKILTTIICWILTLTFWRKFKQHKKKWRKLKWKKKQPNNKKVTWSAIKSSKQTTNIKGNKNVLNLIAKKLLFKKKFLALAKLFTKKQSIYYSNKKKKNNLWYHFLVFYVKKQIGILQDLLQYYFTQQIEIFFYWIKEWFKNVSLISQYIGHFLDKTSYRNLLKKVLYSKLKNKWIGIKFHIAGRINGKLRAHTIIRQAGKINLQQIRAFINFAYWSQRTKWGAFGIQTSIVWEKTRRYGEIVDTTDLKSVGIFTVRVQIPLPSKKYVLV